MNRLRLFSLSLVLAGLAQAVEPPPFVSRTFQEIQSRVISREAESGAILAVRTKDDAPPLGFGLNFSLEVSPHDPEMAVVVLERKLMAGDGVYEKYFLRIDDSIRRELQNQQRLKELTAVRLAQAVAEQKKVIRELSGGKLAYGMTLEEVIRVKGQPLKSDSPGPQAAGSAVIFYPDMSLHFESLQLTHLGPPRK